MGCMSSKVMVKSNSLKEDMNGSFQRMAKGFTVLEELCSPRNGGDPILALLCAQNTAGKLQIRNLTLQSDTDILPALEGAGPETINAWELMADLEEGEEEKQQESSSGIENVASLGKRSKSYHWFPEFEELPGKASFNETEVLKRSRSFHTVQEFDEMLERNWVQKAILETHKSQDFVDASGSILSEGENAKENSIEDEVKEGHSRREINAIDEPNMIKETGILEVTKPIHQQNNEATTGMLENSCGSNYTIKMIDFVEDSIADIQQIAMTESSSRRKVMASGLTTLKIPTDNIDFPAASRGLKEWLNVGGQLFSPGAYVTPKFGPLPITSLNENQCNGDPVFDHETMAAFEEALQQLQAEEERVLQQITENVEEVSIKEKEVDADTQLT